MPQEASRPSSSAPMPTLVDTTLMGIDEAVAAVLDIVRRRLPK